MSILLVMGIGVDAEATSYLLSRVDDHVVLAGTLSEARRRLQEHVWSVIAIDTTLPDGNGFELLADLRAMKIDSGILVLGASADVQHKVLALREGADDYLVRPYEAAELLARVQALSRRFQRQLGKVYGTTLRVGEVELDIEERTVSLFNNRREHLTPTEARILHYLMLHSQRVVERGEIHERLFGPDPTYKSSNAIGVYVRRLRCKIEADPDHPRYIVTVRGGGYRFHALEGLIRDIPPTPAWVADAR